MDTLLPWAIGAAETLVKVLLAIVVVLTLLTPSVQGEAPQVRLVPFVDLVEALDGRGSLRFAIAELIGNVVLFIPLGMALRWRIPTLDVLQVTLLALGVSVVVEVVQGVTGAGRWSDSTDVIMNTLGGVIGAGLAGSGMAPAREP